MIKPIREETFEEWKQRTNFEPKEGETITQGIPVSECKRIYTFDGEPTEQEIEEYFNDLYSAPGSNLWGTKRIIVLKCQGDVGYGLRPIEKHS